MQKIHDERSMNILNKDRICITNFSCCLSLVLEIMSGHGKFSNNVAIVIFWDIPPINLLKKLLLY